MMEYIIYKTTNILNNRFYIGMHSTENVDDGYLGSGRRIKAEIKKYGKENFVKEILEYLPTREALCEREADLVCEELMQNPLCLNLKNGGEGGWDHITKDQIHAWLRSGASAGGKATAAKYGSFLTDADRRRGREANRVNRFKFTTKGLKFSNKTKLKMAESSLGEKNSQFGTCWVTDGIKPIKIKKEQLDEHLAKGFIRGRTVGV